MVKRETKDEAVIPVRLSKSEYRRIVAAAKKAKLPNSTWMRVTILGILDGKDETDERLLALEAAVRAMERTRKS